MYSVSCIIPNYKACYAFNWLNDFVYLTGWTNKTGKHAATANDRIFDICLFIQFAHM